MTTPREAGDEEVYLDDTWIMWFHDPNDPDWTNSSYSQVSTISSANNFWAVQSLLGDKIRAGMFFLMREHVFPCWDDPNNARGGCLSMKVPNETAPQFWETLCSSMLTENMLLPDADEGQDARGGAQLINGLSITPKNTFCVFKIWIGENAPQEPHRYDIPPFMGQMLYRSHVSCIADAASKTSRNP